MNILETLYFPDTAILSNRQFPLFLLFSTIHYIQPVEPDDNLEEQPLDIFMDTTFCQAHTPHPLGKDRDRFLYLINDIKNRKDDYAAQLSHIAIASMSSMRTGSDDSKQEIMSSLLGNSPAISQQSSNDELDALWHARLILTIADILDREEKEVAEALVLLEESETDLLARLQGKDNAGEEESLYDELIKINSKVVKPRTESIKNRVRAWSRIIKGAELPHCPVWTTTRQAAADILFENYEKKKKCAPALLAELQLPALIGGNREKIMKNHAAFRLEAEPHMLTFSKKLIAATNDFSADKNYGAFLSSWQGLLDLHFPAAEYGRTVIKFYYFEDPLTDFMGDAAELAETGPHTLAVFAS